MDHMDKRRIVIKLGSDVVEKHIVDDIAGQTSALVQKQGRDVLIVSSGAIKYGKQMMSICGTEEMPLKQAYAAIGQPRIMELYKEAFRPYGQTIAQNLFTRSDFVEGTSMYRNSVATLEVLLANKVIPIVNENDSVAVEEIRFGDNDCLAALVAKAVGADLLIFLSSVNGVYMNEDTLVADVLPDDIDKLKTYCQSSRSKNGTGGMQSKINSAGTALSAGISAVIANGNHPGVVYSVLDGSERCTYFHPEKI